MTDQELLELLPEYVNGTLSEDGRARVERALETDNGLRRELEFLQTLRESVKTQQVESPTEWGWSRLQRDIRKAAPARRTSNRWWQAAAAAAALVVIVQSAYIVQAPEEPAFRSLSGPVAEENVLQLKLDPQATLQELQELLAGIDAQIVSGPSAIGLYHIAVDDVDAALAVLEGSDIVTYVNRN